MNDLYDVLINRYEKWLRQQCDNYSYDCLYLEYDGMSFIQHIMHDACYLQDTNDLLMLLRADISPNLCVDVEAKYSMLMMASSISYSVVELLLEHRSDVNATSIRGRHALMYAVEVDRATCSLDESLAIVKRLVRGGSNILLKDCDGNTAADIARQQVSEGVPRLLHELGAKSW